MDKIIDPVPVELLKAELTKSKKLQDTNKGHNELYVVTWQDSPNVLTEIGRLREEAFRAGGGSTGNAIDLDEYDKMEKPYKQLIVWDPDDEAIIGGYRFLLGSDASFGEDGQPILASSHQFRFSQKFIDDYLPYVMEVGRSFVSPAYQSSKMGARSIFAMDNLWDGMVAIIIQNPDILYFFGKITVYPSFDHISRDLIYHFLWKHFGDKEELVRPWPDQSVMPDSTPELMDLILNKEEVIEDYKILRSSVRMRGTNVPPNISAYVAITQNMVMFGTAVNRLMHNIEDSAILIPFDEIYQEKKHRHVGAYLRFKRRKRMPEMDGEMERIMVERWLAKRRRQIKKLQKERFAK
ncbi:MAG: GNAT family N-acetyltransferase [Bacteroidales bacterium]|nr:GNAT family N-acetyltransferase [Bacteroidales bacterium]